jgi:hypothetical protein
MEVFLFLPFENMFPPQPAIIIIIIIIINQGRDRQV